MEVHELVVEMKLLERRLTLYEEKYGVLSEDFYQALMTGKLERYDEFDETRSDFSGSVQTEQMSYSFALDTFAESATMLPSDLLVQGGNDEPNARDRAPFAGRAKPAIR